MRKIAFLTQLLFDYFLHVSLYQRKSYENICNHMRLFQPGVTEYSSLLVVLVSTPATTPNFSDTLYNISRNNFNLWKKVRENLYFFHIPN
jgi:hypothetical protein